MMSQNYYDVTKLTFLINSDEESDKNINFARMKVVIDDKIPFIREAAERLFDTVVYRPGSAFTSADVRDADALIVRTRTQCDQTLLAGSKVRFIATATIGYDHLDVPFLQQSGIAWTNCPGCNASSVGQYIHSALLVLKRQSILLPEHATIGVVGVGHVGKAVVKALTSFGCKILRNDPPREELEGTSFASLEEIKAECDIITFHTPLTKSGKYPTYHLANDNFFNTLGKKPVLINAARGAVVDTTALLRALENGNVRAAIIDTWENEPNISLSLLDKVLIGTPHIAGYSADGKTNATRMSLDAVCHFFHIPQKFTITPPPLPTSLLPSNDPEERELQLYDPFRDSQALKAQPQQFEVLRGNYPLRREFWDFGKQR
jgi:erythronate-4-phosphate dehydrogenase